MKCIYWERLSAWLRTRCKNAPSALRNTQTSCQNRTVAVAPMCTVGHSACSAYSPHLLSKVGINKGRDIGPMRSRSCLVVLSVSGATLARAFALNQTLPLQKPSFLFTFPLALSLLPPHEPASVFYCCCWRCCRGLVSCGEVFEEL